MRRGPLASCVLTFLAGLCLSPLGGAEALDLSDLERAAQGNDGEVARWAQRRERMRADFAKVKSLSERLTVEQRNQAWMRFLAAYADQDPFDHADEELRRQARAELGNGGSQSLPAAPAPAPAVAPVDATQLAKHRADYERAKSTDLLPGPVDEKRKQWSEFISLHSPGLAGVAAGDEMLRWAKLRLDALNQTPPVQVTRPLRVFPEFTVGEGTRITDVREHGLAWRLGLRAGDTIIAAGQPPRDLAGDAAALYGYVASLNRQADLRLVVIRGTLVVAVPATTVPPEVRGPIPGRSGLQVGVHCVETSTELVVGAVQFGRLAECAGLDAGDRIVALQGEAVHTQAALEAGIKNLPAEAPLQLDLVRAGVRYRLVAPAAGGAATWTVADPDAGWGPAVSVAKPAPAAAPAAAAQVTADQVKPTAAPTSTAQQGVTLGVELEQASKEIIRVAAVAEASLAARLGIAVGDVFLSAGDPPHPLARPDELIGYLHARASEAEVRLVVLRRANGATPSLVVLPPPPAERSPRGAVPPLVGPDNRKILGFLGLKSWSKQVAAVKPGSVAEALGLCAGDVIESLDGQPISDGNSLQRALQRVDLQGRYVLQVRTADGRPWTVSAPTAGGTAEWTRLVDVPGVPADATILRSRAKP